MVHKKIKIDLFEYANYRDYLKDWFNIAKATRRNVTYRSFSKKAGLKSSNFVMLVIQGKRNLTEESIASLCKALELNKQESEFFRNLVYFNQAKTKLDENLYFQKMISSKKYHQLKPLEKTQYDYVSNWYNLAIRELVASPEFDGSAEWLSQNLFSDLSVQQVKQSLKTLEELQLIKKDKKGKWQQSSAILSTGDEVNSLALFNYQLKMFDLGKKALEDIDAQQRDISCMTLGIHREQLGELKKKIQDFRKEILKMVSSVNEPEEVIQVNIQLFPLSKVGPQND